MFPETTYENIKKKHTRPQTAHIYSIINVGKFYNVQIHLWRLSTVITCLYHSHIIKSVLRATRVL